MLKRRPSTCLQHSRNLGTALLRSPVLLARDSGQHKYLSFRYTYREEVHLGNLASSPEDVSMLHYMNTYPILLSSVFVDL